MVAEKGIFRIEGYNDIDSVKETNLYKVLTYLSYNTAKNDYEIAVQEKIHNKNNIAQYYGNNKTNRYNNCI